MKILCATVCIELQIHNIASRQEQHRRGEGGEADASIRTVGDYLQLAICKKVFLACMTPKWRRRRGIDGDEAEATVCTHGEDGKIRRTNRNPGFWPIWPQDMGTDDVERPTRAARAFALVGGIVGCNTTPKIRRTHLNSGCWSLRYPKTWFLVYMARVDDGGDQERPAKQARVVAWLGGM
ncbi:hypothetical protein B0H10DRAFT_2199291 [Mycena sp. CBHHK59/15]|nr:hypothetical protein B0H10DRAFT_2199291 [Mycena sp. CBHHK59/15]